ncbi:hypothetical protein GH733_002246 [Mirounga leonina]|nr:hypothetical protein GH733_002246 [Mirounga leonina]
MPALPADPGQKAFMVTEDYEDHVASTPKGFILDTVFIRRFPEGRQQRELEGEPHNVLLSWFCDVFDPCSTTCYLVLKKLLQLVGSTDSLDNFTKVPSDALSKTYNYHSSAIWKETVSSTSSYQEFMDHLVKTTPEPGPCFGYHRMFL